MKRLLVIGLLCAGMLLCGCNSGAGQNLAYFVEAREENLGRGESRAPTEVHTYTDANFADTLGFNVVEVASTGGVTPIKYFTMDGWIGQVEFMTGSDEILVLRVASEEGRNLMATYEETHDASDNTRTVGDVEVRTRTAKAGCCMVTWAKGGYQFLLHSNVKQGQPADAEVDAIVQGTRCEAAG